MLSGLVLIDRGFNHKLICCTTLSCFQRIISLYICIGNNSEVDTPVPIPNTEVKHFYADNSVSEDRKLPMLFY